MVWVLETNNTTDAINLANIGSLNLFSSKKDINSTLITVDPQAQYYTEKKLDFEPIFNIDIPVPTKSKLYVLDEIVNVIGATQVYNINFLSENTFYTDFVENKTYCLSNGSNIIETNIFIEYEEFEEQNFIYSYSFAQPLGLTINQIKINGLLYNPGVVDPHTFSFDGTNISLVATIYCGPQPEDIFELKVSGTLKAYASEVYDTFNFDFSSEDIDYIDYMVYNNQVFQTTSKIQDSTLLYNRRSSIAICITKKIGI